MRIHLFACAIMACLFGVDCQAIGPDHLWQRQDYDAWQPQRIFGPNAPVMGARWQQRKRKRPSGFFWELHDCKNDPQAREIYMALKAVEAVLYARPNCEQPNVVVVDDYDGSDESDYGDHGYVQYDDAMPIDDEGVAVQDPQDIREAIQDLQEQVRLLVQNQQGNHQQLIEMNDALQRMQNALENLPQYEAARMIEEITQVVHQVQNEIQQMRVNIQPQMLQGQAQQYNSRWQRLQGWVRENPAKTIFIGAGCVVVVGALAFGGGYLLANIIVGHQVKELLVQVHNGSDLVGQLQQQVTELQMSLMQNNNVCAQALNNLQNELGACNARLLNTTNQLTTCQGVLHGMESALEHCNRFAGSWRNPFNLFR